MTKNELLELSNLFTDNSKQPMIVPSTGKAYQHTSLNKAVQSGKSFMVMPKWNLFIIDSDTKTESFGYFTYKGFLKEKNVPFYEWSSGRPGHRHLVAAFDSPEMQQSAWSLIKSMKLDLRHHRMTRPTLAPHKEGHKVSLLDGYNIQDVIRVLSVRQQTPWVRPYDFSQTEEQITTIQQPIRKTVLDLIANGPTDECADRSYVINQCAVSLANSGYSIDEGARLLSNPKNKISKHIIESRRNDHTRLEYGKLFMRKAYQFIGKTPISQAKTGRVRNYLSILSRILLDLPWRGQQGSSELLSLQAHIRAAYRAGGTTYGLSIREQELTSECALMTCRKANERLIRKGWLSRQEKATADNCTIWTLCLPPEYSLLLDTYTTSSNAGEWSNLETSVPKGVFRQNLVEKHRGLGKSAGRVYAQIITGRKKVSEIVKATGFSRVTVWRALAKLKAVEMIDASLNLTGYVPEVLSDLASRKEKSIKNRQAREREAWQYIKEEYQVKNMRRVA